MMTGNKRYSVFSLKKLERGGVLWTRAGNAWINKDGSMNVYLDVLPMDGRLHVRESAEPKEVSPADPRLRPSESAPDASAAPMEVAQ